MKSFLLALYLFLACICSVFEGLAAECKDVSIGSWKGHSRFTLGGASRIEHMRVKHKYSKADCIYNKSYGFFGVDMWVDKECRAVFIVCYKPGESNILICKSDDMKYKECRPMVGDVWNVFAIEYHSSNPCIRNYSFGKAGNRIWVDKGCQATFRVAGLGYKKGRK